METALIDDMKLLLRITADDYDDEIEDLIFTARMKLQSAGVLVVDETDELIKRAISLYVKAEFGYDNPDANRLAESYKMLEMHLGSSIDYAYYKITINAGEQTSIIFDDTKKETNATGNVVFHSRAKNHVKYIVNGTEYYADITESTTITVGE